MAKEAGVKRSKEEASQKDEKIWNEHQMGLDFDAPSFEFKGDKPLSETLIATPKSQAQSQSKNLKKGKRKNK